MFMVVSTRGLQLTQCCSHMAKFSFAYRRANHEIISIIVSMVCCLLLKCDNLKWTTYTLSVWIETVNDVILKQLYNFYYVVYAIQKLFQSNLILFYYLRNVIANSFLLLTFNFMTLFLIFMMSLLVHFIDLFFSMKLTIYLVQIFNCCSASSFYLPNIYKYKFLFYSWCLVWWW